MIFKSFGSTLRENDKVEIHRPLSPRLRWWREHMPWIIGAGGVLLIPTILLQLLYKDGELGWKFSFVFGTISWGLFASEFIVGMIASDNRKEWAVKHWFLFAVLFVSFPLWSLLAQALLAARLASGGNLSRLFYLTRLFKTAKIFQNVVGLSGIILSLASVPLAVLGLITAEALLSNRERGSTFLPDILSSLKSLGWLIPIFALSVGLLTLLVVWLAKRRGKSV